MSLEIVKSFLVPPPALKLDVGTIIKHIPRGTSYEILFKTMIKMDDGRWEYGWCYREVSVQHRCHDEFIIEHNPEGEIYSRPSSKFDSDWTQVIL